MTPFNVKTKITGETVPVPCGKCPQCVARRVSQWSFRLMQEEKVSTSAYFITLTYDTKYCKVTRSGYMSLCKRDVQLFFKRLRKTHKGERSIKYYVVGEYGGKTNRPHYHAILFNAQIEKIQDAWQLGSIHYGDVSGASIGYCLKYMAKKGKIPMHKNDDRVPEFGLMSKKLGANYLTDKMVQWHINSDERMYCNLKGGKKISMPRYYKDKIFSDKYFESEEKAKLTRKRIGFFAKKLLDKKKEEEMKKEGDMYERNRIENIKAAFRNMDLNYKKNQKL